MTKKDYERAARIMQSYAEIVPRGDSVPMHTEGLLALTEGFIELFADDNPRFDEARFRAACQPGANVRARPRKVKESNHAN